MESGIVVWRAHKRPSVALFDIQQRWQRPRQVRTHRRQLLPYSPRNATLGLSYSTSRRPSSSLWFVQRKWFYRQFISAWIGYTWTQNTGYGFTFVHSKTQSNWIFFRCRSLSIPRRHLGWVCVWCCVRSLDPGANQSNPRHCGQATEINHLWLYRT